MYFDEIRIKYYNRLVNSKIDGLVKKLICNIDVVLMLWVYFSFSLNKNK